MFGVLEEIENVLLCVVCMCDEIVYFVCVVDDSVCVV